jgi:hypothetical protein
MQTGLYLKERRRRKGQKKMFKEIIASNHILCDSLHKIPRRGKSIKAGSRLVIAGGRE